MNAIKAACERNTRRPAAEPPARPWMWWRALLDVLMSPNAMCGCLHTLPPELRIGGPECLRRNRQRMLRFEEEERRAAKVTFRSPSQGEEQEFEQRLHDAEADRVSEDTINDLQEQLDHLKGKVQAVTTATGSGEPAKPDAFGSVPKPATYDISAPRLPSAVGKGEAAEPIIEIKTGAVLAQEAKARLDDLEEWSNS
eukprot:s977_g2.t1